MRSLPLPLHLPAIVTDGTSSCHTQRKSASLSGSGSWGQWGQRFPSLQRCFFLECQELTAPLSSTRGWDNWEAAVCSLQECRVCVTGLGEFAVICKSKANKVSQGNLFRGHSGFPQAIKMLKPLNISDLFSCIPGL